LTLFTRDCGRIVVFMDRNSRFAWRLLAALAAVLALAVVPAAHAVADDGEESKVAAELVLQAIGLIANDEPAMTAAEKVDDALNAPDKHGVAMDLVGQAKTALDAGDTRQARSLLADSLGKPAESERVTGEETGTTTVSDPLDPRDLYGASTWILSAISLVVALAGVALAIRYRPGDTLSVLRRRLATAPEEPREEE
jgi:hypothetical protein